MTARAGKKQRCTALTRAGQPCRAWAMGDSVERYGRPLCRAHAAPEGPAGELVPAGSWAGAHKRRLLYGLYFDPEEVAALEALAAEAGNAESLAAEVETARIVLRRLLALMGEPGALLETAPVVLHAALTVARLLRDRQALAAAAPEGQPEIDEALDILSEEWGIEL